MIPVHGVVIHESPVALQVELAKSEHSQSNKGHGEDQAQQRVRSTTALCNTGEHLQFKLLCTLMKPKSNILHLLTFTINGHSNLSYSSNSLIRP